MQAGQTFGPFVIEKALGSGAMGAVYRARYVKTKARVAIKVMGLGMTANDSAMERFRHEAEILKKLKHPGIVRFLGAGREKGMPYYAMEYVEGESLDKVMARRGRRSREEVVALGQQLCEALQHAHEKGIVHRDLKPSNLMVLEDNTIKLTDFGIAKDPELTALTAANCTVGTAAYMSPEQCRGDRNLTFKSDLYSLGVVFYELLTGRKPFMADTPMEMFMQHLQATCERPSRLVPETPVWLDTLICQLLEKKPEQRPRDAAMVGRALEEVADKVEALQSAGADAVGGRGVVRPKVKREEKDKEAARALRGKKKGKKKAGPAFYQTGWFVGLGALVLMAVLGGAIWFALQPPSLDTLQAQAAKLMETNDPDKYAEAVATDGPLDKFQRYYDKSQDPKATKLREWTKLAHRTGAEQLLGRLVTSAKTKGHIKPKEDVESVALKAALAEDDGDLAEARKQWEELRQKFQGSGHLGWNLLAEYRLAVLDAVENHAKQLDALVEKAAQTDKQIPLKPTKDSEQMILDALQAEVAATAAARDKDATKEDKAKKWDEAREAWKKIREKYPDDPAERGTYLLAAKKYRDLEAKTKPE
jgi:serine/threonine-protein kinase